MIGKEEYAFKKTARSSSLEFFFFSSRLHDNLEQVADVFDNAIFFDYFFNVTALLVSDEILNTIQKTKIQTVIFYTSFSIEFGYVV